MFTLRRHMLMQAHYFDHLAAQFTTCQHRALLPVMHVQGIFGETGIVPSTKLAEQDKCERWVRPQARQESGKEVYACEQRKRTRKQGRLDLPGERIILKLVIASRRGGAPTISSRGRLQTNVDVDVTPLTVNVLDANLTATSCPSIRSSTSTAAGAGSTWLPAAR